MSVFRADSPHHAVCRPWMETEIVSGRAFGLSTLSLAALLRITTTPRFHEQPSTAAEVFTFAGGLLDLPNCMTVAPGQRHWSLFCDMVRAANARSKLMTDAWYAALAIEHGCEWVTLDRDFAKFPGLKWRLLA